MRAEGSTPTAPVSKRVFIRGFTLAIPTRIESDVYIAGDLSARSVSLPNATVTNAMVAASAGIAASKLQHQHRVHFSQANVTAAAETRVIYRCYGATGTLLQFAAGSIAACTGNATVTVDLKKNGTTVLSSVITLDNGNSARVAEAGTLNVTALAVGDVLEVVVAVNAGSGSLGTGLFAAVTLQEEAA